MYAEIKYRTATAQQMKGGKWKHTVVSLIIYLGGKILFESRLWSVTDVCFKFETCTLKAYISFNCEKLQT